MKKQILFSLIITSPLFVIAQTPYMPFPEDSARWSIWDNDASSIHSFQIKMYGDTVINGISYNKVYKSPAMTYPPINTDTLHCFIRQDTAQKKVYVRYPYFMYNDSSEILLYDFSLQVNDTFNYKLVTDGSVHRLVILSITDSLQTNTDYRRIFSTQSIFPWDWGPGCDQGCGWIEGIGNFCTFLYPEIPIGYCDFTGHHFNTECFWHNGVFVTGGNFCDFNSVGINKEEENENEIEITPNPVLTESTIKFNNKAILGIKVINALGQLVLERNKEINELTISTKDFEDGIYLVIANFKEGVYTSKFIVRKITN